MDRKDLQINLERLLSDVVDQHGVPWITPKAQAQAANIMALLDASGWGPDEGCPVCDERREWESDAYEGYLTSMEILTEGR